MAKRVPAIILLNPGEHAEASQKEHSANNAADTYWETDIGHIFVRTMSFLVFVNMIDHRRDQSQNPSILSDSCYMGTYKGIHVREAEDARTRTPTQTDPMLIAAIFRRFVSSILPNYLTWKFFLLS